MLARGSELLTQARRAGVAVAAFNVYNLEAARAAILAAQEMGTPVILQTGVAAYRFGQPGGFGRALIEAAERASVPVGVHLDHAERLEDIEAAIQDGYPSVMIDGSRLPLAENTALVRAVVEVAHRAGVVVEAELGGVAGAEDQLVSDSREAAMTDPETARRFVEETGADSLAVAIGNAHGLYKGKPELDLERLARIAERVSVPLVLHGASGIPAEDLQAAIQLGIAKVNFNTELRQAYFGELQRHLDEAARLDLLALMERTSQAMEGVMRQKIAIVSQR